MTSLLLIQKQNLTSPKIVAYVRLLTFHNVCNLKYGPNSENYALVCIGKTSSTYENSQ